MSPGRTTSPGSSAMRARWGRLLRDDPTGRTTFALLTALVAVTVLLILRWPMQTPVALLAVPLVLANLLLPPWQMPWFVGLIVLALASTMMGYHGDSVRQLVRIAVVMLIAVLVLWASVRRARLGVTGNRAEAMLVELRERIQRQGGQPQLPEGWEMEQSIDSASVSPFTGDFVVATRRGGPDHLEFCLVDVSGKGHVAGVRALQLSGALGGILGSLPAEDFLPAANEYLLDQDWEEGFATGIHVALDLADGTFEIRSAGHPPAMVRSAGTGRWQQVQADGPALGLIPGAAYAASRGALRSGDVLMVCTDGVVESSRREVSMGVDRLMGLAEATLRASFAGSAERLMQQVGGQDDDRALVLLRRR